MDNETELVVDLIKRSNSILEGVKLYDEKGGKYVILPKIISDGKYLKKWYEAKTKMSS